MAGTFIGNSIKKIVSKMTGGSLSNVFNQAFYQWLGGLPTQYDQNNKEYLEKGYNMNPTVYAIINKQTVKTVSVPYCIKQVEDKQAYGKLRQMELATKGNLSLLQTVKKKSLELKAYSDKEMAWPLADPNPTQTWADIFALYKTYMKITGNFYQYNMSPKDGANAGQPLQVYALPSHLMQIVLKKDAQLLTTENPIDYYMLIEGLQWIRFEVEDVIHVKYANPNFDWQGAQLYGMSPLRAALRNVNSQNSAIDNNIKMLQSSGAFGFLYGKGPVPWTPEQAASIKDRLKEMDASPERLAKIAGSSAEVGFQRISLTTEELRPFEYIEWDTSVLANALNFPDELLNADTNGALQGNSNNDARKQLITDDIKPDLILLQNAYNKQFIPKFKGYENSVVEWDCTELPEMQTDMKTQAEALNLLPVTPNEIRVVFGYETKDDDGMDVVWINSGKQRIDDVSPGIIDNANGF